MITTVLPGLREIRTPLAAGYLWLIFAWLLVAPHVASGDLPKPLRSLVDVDGSWHAIAVGSALSFAALLLGVMADGIYETCVHAIERRAVPRDPLAGFFGWHALQSRFASSILGLRTRPTQSSLHSLNIAAREAVRDAEQRLEPSNHDIRDLALMLGFVTGRSDRPLGEAEEAQVRKELAATKTEKVRQSLAAWLALRTLDQLELLARRLVTDNAELYADYDRLKSEAQFRTAVTPPLLALSVALAVVWTPWIALAVAGLPILIRQAIRAGDRASDLLIDALLIGKVKAPAFEQFARAASEFAQRDA